MEIKFDYRFDTEGFFTQERRIALNLAGNIWSNIIQDDFTEVPANTEITIQNPQTGAAETIVLEEAIEDLVIFVGASPEPFNGVGTENNNPLAQAQYHGDDIQGDIFQRRISNDFRGEGVVTDFEPWIGTISFATNLDREWDFSLDDPNPDRVDFVSVALREIGRVLGVGTAPIFDFLAADGAFNGVNAREVNNGNPVPLEANLDYIAADFAGESLILDSDIISDRRSPTDLDLAILADIGYQIAGFTKQGSRPEIGTAEGDFIFGAAIDERLNGLAGNDEIQGNSGNDTLLGDEGNDTLLGNAGDDELLGGVGNDSLLGETGDDLLFGGTEADILLGDLGNDTIRGDNDNDTLLGGEGNDSLLGNSDEDELRGDVGDDVLRGGDGSDTLFGQVGNDTIEGGRNNDTLIGDTGSDRFELGFNFGSDRINDFINGEDKIAVSARYNFETDTYDLNDPSEIIAAITDTGTVSDSTDLFTEITLRDTSTVIVVNEEPLTTEDIEIYFPFQSQVIPTASGFTIQFNQDFNSNNINLYQGTNPDADIPDVRLVSDSTGKVITGSLLARESDRSLTFVKNDGVLAPDDYTLTLFSRGDGFTSSTGELLDGDVDGIAGDNFVTQFTIEETEQRVLSLDDFGRGIGQKVNSSLDSEGIAVSLDNGAEITQVDFTFVYDANIMTVEDVTVNPELGEDWTIITKDLSNQGTAIISLSGTTPLTSGEIDLVHLQASIPDTASTNRSGILSLEAVELNNGEIAAIGDSAYQQVAYLGDTNGDLNYTAVDAYQISQLATGISNGLTNFARTNPQIIADINGDGVISAFDSYLVSQKGMGATVDFIPDIPVE